MCIMMRLMLGLLVMQHRDGQPVRCDVTLSGSSSWHETRHVRPGDERHLPMARALGTAHTVNQSDMHVGQAFPKGRDAINAQDSRQRIFCHPLT